MCLLTLNHLASVLTIALGWNVERVLVKPAADPVRGAEVLFVAAFTRIQICELLSLLIVICFSTADSTLHWGTCLHDLLAPISILIPLDFKRGRSDATAYHSSATSWLLLPSSGHPLVHEFIEFSQVTPDFPQTFHFICSLELLAALHQLSLFLHEFPDLLSFWEHRALVLCLLQIFSGCL